MTSFYFFFPSPSFDELLPSQYDKSGFVQDGALEARQILLLYFLNKIRIFS